TRAVISGTADSNLLLKHLSQTLTEVPEQGYRLANENIHGKQVVTAAGQTPAGAVNAMYGLLRELGYGFYLGSEAIPERLPSDLGNEPIVRKPALKIRGVLPWYNFLNSPTTWDPQDHRAFVDQLIRLGANFVGFHTYDSEPFGAYEEKGKMVKGGRLLNTRSVMWNTQPTPTNRFGFGTDKLFVDEYFGAASTQLTCEASEVVRREQEIMRDALDYAKRRGLHTCLGFEIHGDPTNPQERDVFLKRINHLLNQYPSLDYIWIWQPETQGVQGFRQRYTQHILPTKHNPTSPLGRYGVARREIFRRIVERTAGAKPFFKDNEEGKMARAIEGARLEQYAQLAIRAFSHRDNPPRLIISGWGGDERLLSAEYYDGLDKLLPSDVIFASLDHIWPRNRVDAIYRELPKRRERWPIPWLECDGDEWHPQPYVHPYEGIMNDIHRGGSQGVLGIHWRTREVAENFGYMVAYAWNPGLKAEQFFADLAKRCYGPAIAEEMASIHSDLDSLGYRWVGGAGQSECAAFRWGPGEAKKAESLSDLRNKIVKLKAKASKGQDKLEWLINRIDWVLTFRNAELAAVKAKELLNQAHSVDSDQASSLAAEALALLDNGAMAGALQAYAKRVSTRGEYGVLATINTKAVAAWRDLRNECLKILGRTGADEAATWAPEARIILPRFYGSVTEHEDLEMLPMVLGGQQAWIHYRTLGKKYWTSRPMAAVKGWVQRAAIPAKDVVGPGLEFGFSFTQSADKPMSFGPTSITVFPKLEVNTTPRPIKPANPPRELILTVKEGDKTPVELIWNNIPEADYFKVHRDDKVIVETAVTFFPDVPTKFKVSYVVKAIGDGKVIAKSESITFRLPERQPINEKITLKTHINQSGVLLCWPKTKSSNVVAYHIFRHPDISTSVAESLIAEVPASRSIDHVFRDKPPKGKWIYTVRAADVYKSLGAAESINVEYPPKSNNTPAFNLSLIKQPPAAKLTGHVKFCDEGAIFGNGYIEIPHQPYMNLDYGMTMMFEFKADSTEGAPVLFCHGRWPVEGWFVQILSGSLIIRTPHGDVRGPKIKVGKWYSVRFVFDGQRPHLKVNDRWHDQGGTVIRPVPVKQNLIIGQYINKTPQYAFRGSIRNFTITADTLFENGKMSQKGN
ncbi:MAG: hypothetical protein JSV03_01570, partial [Planctomycetota bacterium]